MPNNTQRFTIDLERNKEAARIAADLEPGAKVEATLSVVSKDDKTLVVELEEIIDPNPSDDDEMEDEMEEMEESPMRPL